MNTNNIRNMNTNTLFVKHLKYEYTQFLLFIFTNIIRSSTPPLALSFKPYKRLQKSNQNTEVGLERATLWPFASCAANSGIGSKFWCWLRQCCNLIIATVDSSHRMTTNRPVANVDAGSCCYSRARPSQRTSSTNTGKSKKGTSRKKSSGAATLGLLPCLPKPNAVAGEAVDVPGTSQDRGLLPNKRRLLSEWKAKKEQLCILNYVMKFINNNDHSSCKLFAPIFALAMGSMMGSYTASEDYFCAHIFGIFEYSRILYFCSIRNTNTPFCVHLKYEYIFMRHPDSDW